MWEDLNGDFGEDGLSDALADLNDAFGELDGFGAFEGAFTMAVPVLVGGGVTFGTVAALDYFISDPETKESVLPYKWLIGAGVGTVAGLIVWKTMDAPVAGVVTIASSLMLALAAWGIAKLAEPEVVTPPAPPPAATGYRAYEVSQARPIYGDPTYRGFGDYEVSNAAGDDLYKSPIYSGMGDPMLNPGRGTMGMGEGSMVNLGGLGDARYPDMVSLRGAINPGVFG